MHSSGKTLTLTGICILGLTTIRPAAAQNLVYTLSGVTFNDGAVATGSFDFNPTTQTFGPYSITTTNGVSDNLTGALYTPTSSKSVAGGSGSDAFTFKTNSLVYNYLVLDTSLSATTPGTYSIDPGYNLSLGQFNRSGELAPVNMVARGITTGSLIVTNAPVPEASTTVSFGLLLALGLGGVVVAARKKKTAETA